MYYVYCVTTKELEEKNIYKIGYSKSLSGRKDDFDGSTINFNEWYYIDAIAINDEENARKLEKKLHLHFAKERISDKREFFKIYDVTLINGLFKKIKEMGKENLQSGQINRLGESISNLLKTREIYGGDLTRIFLEKIHNAYAAHAKNIWIKIENEGKSITYTDDGDGFTYSQLLGFAKNDRFHLSGDGPGIWGIGAKDSDRAIADFENADGGISTVEYISSTDGINQAKMIWHICKIQKLYEKPEVYYNTQGECKNCHKGTIIKHDEITKITAERLSEAKQNIRFLCSTYKMNIYISKHVGSGNNSYELLCNFFDPLYLNKLDNYNDGIKVYDDGSIHKITSHKFVNYENNVKEIKVKQITFYMSSEFYESTGEDDFVGASALWGGLYFFYKNTYLSKPIINTSIKTGVFHAYNRIRTLIIFEDENTAKLFGIRSVKTEQIKYKENFILKKYLNDNNDNFETVVLNELNYFSHLDDKQRDLRNSKGLGYIDAIKQAAKSTNNYNVNVVCDVVDADKIEIKDDETPIKTKTRFEVYKEKQNSLKKEIELYNSLSDEEKTDIKRLYQFCVSNGSFSLKGSTQKNSSLMGSFDEEINVLPWSLHNYVTSGINEIVRVYEFIKNKEKGNSNKIKDKLNKYIISCYETKTNNLYDKKNKLVERSEYVYV